jgi:DNA primase catalytic core
MNELQDWLTYEVYPAWFQAADRLLPEFGFKFRNRYWQSTTKTKIDGSEGDSIGKVYYYANTPYGLKDYTRGFITLWQYISQRERLDNRQTLQFLADSVQIRLPNQEYFDSDSYSQKQLTDALWEDAHTYLRLQLFENQSIEAKKHLNYLIENRGYSLDEIRNMEIGFLPSVTELYDHLNKKYNPSIVTAILSLKKDNRIGTTHQLSLPFRSPAGIISGFAFRTIMQDVHPKYLNTSGSEKGLFNLNGFFARNQDIIVVEGQFDALILSERLNIPVVAVTGGGFNEHHLDLLEKSKAKSITLCFDGDEAGRSYTRKAIQKCIQRTHWQVRLYVATLPEGTDPDSILKEEGKEAFSEILQNAKRYYEYLADTLIPPFDFSLTEKNTDAILDEIAKTALDLPVEVRQQFIKHIEINSILPEIGFTYIQKRLQEIQVQKDHEHQRKTLHNLISSSLELNNRHQTREAIHLLREEVRKLASQNLRSSLSPYLPQDFLSEIEQTNEGLLTGYPSLDQFVRIPQGAITIVAGRTGHGKTTFLLNLLWSLHHIYPELAFYFFTYEEERKYITLKLLNLIIDDKLDDRDNRYFLRKYLKAGRTDLKRIEFAKKQLFIGMNEQKIRIIDQNFQVERLAESLTLIKSESPLPVGAVIVDYIQKIPSERSFESRQRELQHISNLLLQEVAKELSLPLIVGAQLNRETDKTLDGKPKLHQLREAGDLEQDANLVLSVFNPAARDEYDPMTISESSAKKNERKETIINNSIIPLEIKALKNRDGAVNAKAILAFNPLTGRILEPKGDLENNYMFNG